MVETNELSMETEDQALVSAEASMEAEEMSDEKRPPLGTINAEIREDPNNI